ncbi:hypothetical protein [Occultella gossypii]|uniref:Uncharacterized protein n=1 Tax=Occultella gossypii TaxID=2800820 RepID=A0ABS7S8Y7_9MICO|nr:hypothetical protein [Occultella gossypii]MBZ2196572.1 hypothetical protein [Occultella gossypii]
MREVLMGERRLVFRDAQGHKRSFAMGDHDHLKFWTAFSNFVKKHLSEENSTFRLERVLTDETLIIETAHGIVGRVRNGASPEVSYRRYERRTDGTDLQLRFAHSGYAALDDHGPWTSDRESLLPDDSFENLELAWVREMRESELRRREIAALPKLDKKALNQFCKTWADTGHNEYIGDSDEYYVLFHSRTVAEAGAARDELLKTVGALGLHLVEAPASAPSGEVWVRCDPRVDLELEKWA